jgi:hypothetical protein
VDFCPRGNIRRNSAERDQSGNTSGLVTWIPVKASSRGSNRARRRLVGGGAPAVCASRDWAPAEDAADGACGVGAGGGPGAARLSAGAGRNDTTAAVATVVPRFGVIRWIAAGDGADGAGAGAATAAGIGSGCEEGRSLRALNGGGSVRWVSRSTPATVDVRPSTGAIPVDGGAVTSSTTESTMDPSESVRLGAGAGSACATPPSRNQKKSPPRTQKHARASRAAHRAQSGRGLRSTIVSVPLRRTR